MEHRRPFSSKFARSGLGVLVVLFGVGAFSASSVSGVSVAAATKSSTTVKRSVSRAVASTKTTKKKITKATTKTVPKKASTSAVRLVPTQVAGVAITAPTTVRPPLPPAPSTTLLAPPVTTAIATSTTLPAPLVAPFDVVAVTPRVDAVVGTTATFSIVVAQRGESNPIALTLVGLPNGMAATLSPNPATGIAVLRVSVPTDAIAADYPLRVVGSFGGAQAWATVTLRVTAVPASTTTSTTTTTIDTSGLGPSFGFRITADGKTLVSGGQVQFEIEPIYDTGYNGSIEYFVSGLPDGVWHGFSEKISTTKTVLWLSSTVPLRAGRYPFTITGVSKGLKKSGEVVLIIG